MRTLAALCIVAIGCSNGSSKGAARCQTAVKLAEDKVDAREKALDPNYAVTPEGKAMVIDVLVAACKRDGWSDVMLTCVENVTEDSMMFDCLTKNLSGDQATALKQQLIEALVKKRKAEHVPGLP
jgi:hypothetical protein